MFLCKHQNSHNPTKASNEYMKNSDITSWVCKVGMAYPFLGPAWWDPSPFLADVKPNPQLVAPAV